MHAVRIRFCSTMMILSLVGCSQSTQPPEAIQTTPKRLEQVERVRVPAPVNGAAIVSLPKKASSVNDDFELPREYETESLETLFSRVLSRGFRTRTKSANLSRERCVKAMQAVISRGHTSASFLESKLNQGSLSEKALAMWLIGSMGPRAKRLARDVAYAMSLSWTVPIKRCTKKGKQESECKRKVFGNVPSWTVKAGCRALARLRDRKAVSNVAALGLSQEMLVPCLPVLTDYISDGANRDRVIESWSLKAVRSYVLKALEPKPKAALSFAIYWLHSLQSKKETNLCPLEGVLGPVTSPIMTQLKGRLQPQELGALTELKSSSTSPKVRQCIVKYLDAFGVYDPALPALPRRAPSEQLTLSQLFEVGEFCPADQ